jgi:prolyl-tRNA editing enzyme YbaK/EbsC (Cys-tRNA(Pro) deacylase)
MSIERVKTYFARFGMEGRVWAFDTSSATVELAAGALHVRPARIAKTLSFQTGAGCLIIVTAGDARIDNQKFKARLGFKARMLPLDEVARHTGYAVGGVCPFDLPHGLSVYLDVSLRRFNTVFPACGSDNSAIELSPDDLYRYANATDWVDVCKDWPPGDDLRPTDAVLDPLPTLSDGEIRLALTEAGPADERTGDPPYYRFAIFGESDGAVLGRCELRIGYTRNTYYGGNIAYTVPEEPDGHPYAEKACRLLFQLAALHGMPHLYIACPAGDQSTRRMLGALGGELAECCAPPSYTALYQAGVREPHCIFRLALQA